MIYGRKTMNELWLKAIAENDAEAFARLVNQEIEARVSAQQTTIRLAKTDLWSHATDSMGNSWLHQAAWRGADKIVDYLLNQGAQINAANKLGQPAVFYALGSGNEATLDAMLANPALDLKVIDNKGSSILHVLMAGAGSKWQSIEYVFDQLVKNGADLEVVDSKRDLLVVATQGDKPALIAHLVQHYAYNVDAQGGSTGRLPLQEAIRLSREDSLSKLLTLGANPMASDSNGISAASALFYHHKTALIDQVFANIADFNQLDKSGVPLLQHAGRAVDFFGIDALAKKGASANVLNTAGYSALHDAVLGMEFDVITRLMTYPGVNREALTKDGLSVLHLAMQSASYTILDPASGKQVPAAWHTLVKFDIDFAKADPGHNLLNRAIQAKSTYLVTEMHRTHHYALDQLDDMGAKPLDMAIIGGVVPVIRTLLEMMREEGVEIHLPNNNGRTPLMVAAKNGYADVCELLLEFGADPLVTDPSGRTAIDYAHVHADTVLGNEYAAVEQLLREKGAELKVADPVTAGESTAENTLPSMAQVLSTHPPFSYELLHSPSLKTVADFGLLRLSYPEVGLNYFLANSARCAESGTLVGHTVSYQADDLPAVKLQLCMRAGTSGPSDYQVNEVILAGKASGMGYYIYPAAVGCEYKQQPLATLTENGKPMVLCEHFFGIGEFENLREGGAKITDPNEFERFAQIYAGKGFSFSFGVHACRPGDQDLGKIVAHNMALIANTDFGKEGADAHPYHALESDHFNPTVYDLWLCFNAPIGHDEL
jgi:ankyrin repeat protein